MKFLNKKLFLFLLFSLFLVTGFFIFNNSVQAASSSLDVGLQQVSATGLPSGDIRTIVAKIIKTALGLLGTVALVLMLYAGYLWMTAGGDDEKIGTSKKILINATIGLAIILSAYAIVSFVMNKLVDATGAGVMSKCEVQRANAGSYYGGDCPDNPGNIDCPYGNCNSKLLIVSKPSNGNVCIRNVAPLYVFNIDVDVNTLNNNVVVVKASDLSEVVGSWNWQPAHHNIAYFKPTNGACPGPDTGKDCFEATTNYTVKIKNGGKDIQSVSGKALDCPLGSTNCNDVSFTTGDGVDRQDPVISIISPTLSNTNLQQGNSIPVQINYTDDGGLQNLIFNVDNLLVTTTNVGGCQKSGTVTMTWPTNNIGLGTHSLKAIGFDMAANIGEGNSKANLKPAHCFDQILNEGEKLIDCGGECGVCDGDKCVSDTDCTSGYCYKQPANAAEGVCVQKTIIDSYSPFSAAVGDYVSIIGKYFGNSKGHVYFSSASTTVVSKPVTSTCQYNPSKTCTNIPGECDIKTINSILINLPTPVVKSGVCSISVNNLVWWPFQPQGISLPCDSNVECSFSALGNVTGTLMVDSAKSLSGNTMGGGYQSSCKKITELTVLTRQCLQNFVTSTANLQIEAPVVNCGPGFNNWSNNQIIVIVPQGAVSGKISVFNPLATGTEQYNIKYYDTTGDGFNHVPNFTLTTTSHPGICGIDPDNGPVGTAVTVRGKNFSTYDSAKSFVTFNDAVKAKINGWVNNTDAIVIAVVPSGLGNGNYGVKIVDKNNLSSNSVLYTVSGSNSEAPIISDISAPVSTTMGDYLTITGKNFGPNQGVVWFQPINNATANKIDGSFSFPSACKNSVWKDDQIVVKVPTGLSTGGAKYTIQVRNVDKDLVSALDNSKIATIYDGSPSPGLCAIDPTSGYVPFAAANLMTAYGEYLNNTSKFYFWKNGGQSNLIASTLVGVNVTASNDGKSLTTFPGAGVAGVADITSGLVFAYRDSDKKQSNGLLFSTNDCTKNGCASGGDQCCQSGTQIGQCIAKGAACAGVFKNSGFVWLFSTKDIVEPPRVVERCGKETELGLNLPSPSPSTKWNIVGHNDASQVCQTALVTIEFSGKLTQNTVDSGTVVVKSCGSVDANGACTGASSVVTMANDSYKLQTAGNNKDYLSLRSSVGKWSPNQLYQVILAGGTNGIKALPSTVKDQNLSLVASNPCGGDSAYCFTFKTGEGDCVLRQVVVTPNNFWANYLESPMRDHGFGGSVYDVFYRGNGLSNQYCTMMDMSQFAWQWGVNNKNNSGKIYAQISGAQNVTTTQVDTKANTMGIGLAGNSVDVMATATFGSIIKGGSSPLTIDLSNPEVIDFWPKCLEACTNAAVGAKFNVTMSTFNQSSAVQLMKCNDENCLSATATSTAATFDVSSGNTILKIANDVGGQALLPNTLYQVVLSATGTPGQVGTDQLWSASDSYNLATTSKPYNKAFVWRFRTKKEACKVDRVAVLPTVFTAVKLKDSAIFQAQPYAAPDACSATGQKLNPWSQDWNWSSSLTSLADVQQFKTKGSGAFCTASCVLKGSTVPSGQGSASYPICGNDKVEAGEDCDAPNKNIGCSLACKFLGNPNTTPVATTTDIGLCGDGFVSSTKGEGCDPNNALTQFGCSNFCLRTGSKMQTAAKEVSSSICGNGMVGSGEDCDLGVAASTTVSTSSLNCSNQCLHTGTRLSSKWCFDHSSTTAFAYGGFDKNEYNFYCNQSYSQCGDGVKSPDEDVNCEFNPGTASGKNAVGCNDRCLRISSSTPDTNCSTPNSAGCDANLQHTGSSLLYTVPSVCGDGVAGTGEDSDCETDPYLTNQWHKTANGGLLTDPWVLVLGKAGITTAVVTTTVVVQESNITGAVTVAGKTTSGVGKYQVKCGYKSDEDCQAAYQGDPNVLNVGVGTNSCCYFKSKLTDVYPGNTSTINIAQNICVNTFIQAGFDSIIDPATLPGNFVIARSMTTACTGGLEDVSTSTSFLTMNDPSLPWYKKVWNNIIVSIKSFFGLEVNANTWCAGADVGGIQVIEDEFGGSKVLFSLNQPLATLTDYVIILKKGIKNIQGVSIESKPDGKAVGWRFKTGSKICEISEVSIDPDQHYFSVPNDSINLIAKGVTLTPNKQFIQPVMGYSWNYLWGPKVNASVLIGNSTTSLNTVTSQNNNGEVDVHASANITENILDVTKVGLTATGKSHIIVFICEHPWPPKQIVIPGQTSSTVIFPYEDKIGNNDGFDLINNIFNNSLIPAASVGTGYFNFSTYYCADNGEHGFADDLPYLRPAVQTAANTQNMGAFVNTGNITVTTVTNVTSTVPATSTCANNPSQACILDSDCGVNKIVKTNGTISFAATSTKSGVCAIMATSAANATRYVPRQQGANLVGPAFSCDSSSECNTSLYTISWFLSVPGWNYNTWFDCLKLSSIPGVNISTCDPHTKEISTAITTTSVQAASTSTPFSVFKRFIFTSDKNSDAVGIQVLSNPKHLSPRDWYADQHFTGTLQDVKIDGYDAVTDGNNIYVSALNFDPTVSSVKGNLYTNIYLFSINNGASLETKKVFENILKNLKFNINLTNYGYCGADMNNPGDTTACISDFDCKNGEVCSVQKDKLKRDIQRVKDMGKIEKSLNDYSNEHGGAYPNLQAGTYLSGQTISTWPSWSLLSNAVGGVFPSDPINKLGKAGTCSSSTGQFCIDDATCKSLSLGSTETCIIHDPSTGWSTADKRFSFACATNSLAYRYVSTSTSATSSDYLVKVRMEDTGLTIDNSNAFIADFIVNSSNFNVSNISNNGANGICNQNKEITTMNQGTCGDGKVNLNKSEQCDPPGGVVWNQSECNAPATATTDMHGMMCSDICKLSVATTTKCGILSKCGNGKVELGESCDEGSLNGQYNHCNLSCTGMGSSCGDGFVSSTYEVCDTAFDYYPVGSNNYPSSVAASNRTGWCYVGLRGSRPCGNDDDCRILPEDWTNINSIAWVGTYAKCVPINFNNNRYGSTKEKSCNFDCQKNGPYCGDGVVQKEFGEECEGNESCTINGVAGYRSCGTDCRWMYGATSSSPKLYYSFDDVVTVRTGWKPLSATVVSDLSFVLNKGWNGVGPKNSITSLLDSAQCVGTALQNCPASLLSSSVKGRYMEFNGTSNYFKIPSNEAFRLNEITFATWINFSSTTPAGVWKPLFNKVSSHAEDNRWSSHERDFGFYYVKNASNTIDILHMYSSYHFNQGQLVIGTGAAAHENDTIIFGISSINPNIPVDTWHHIAVTVNAARETRYYVDGVLLNPGNLAGTGFMNGSSTLKADHDYSLYIGRGDVGSDGSSSYFKGKMDDFNFFGRALAEGEIKDLYQHGSSLCQVKIVPPKVIAAVVPGSCGDGKVGPDEACDGGPTNGTPCIPAYNKSCTYCMDGCKLIKTVEAAEYCGDGIVNGTEKCDATSGGDIYSSVTTVGNSTFGLGTDQFIDEDHNGYYVLKCDGSEVKTEYNLSLNVSSTYWYSLLQWNKLLPQIGTKSCVNNCSGISNKCIECGLKKDGPKISGSIINVLDPKSNNPLLATASPKLLGTVSLLYSANGQNAVEITDTVAFQQYGSASSFTQFLLKTDAYSQNIATLNSDPVCSDPAQKRSYKIALNADWDKNHLIDFPVFGTTTPDKYNLLLSPVINSSTRKHDIRVVVSWVDVPGLSTDFNAGFVIPGGVNGQTIFEESGFQTITGVDYNTKLVNPGTNIWYHGNALNTNTSNVESYTINTLNMATSAFAFYVRSPASPIKNFRNSAKLKVEVYVPENDSDTRHFARPVKTYYLNQSIPSDNSAAQFWHVFNVLSTTSTNAIANVGDNIGDINMIQSAIKMKYIP